MFFCISGHFRPFRQDFTQQHYTFRHFAKTSHNSTTPSAISPRLHTQTLHLRPFRQDFTQQHYTFGHFAKTSHTCTTPSAISPRLHTQTLHLRPFRQDFTQQHYTFAQQHLGDAAELRHFRLLLRAVIKTAFHWLSFLAGANQLRVTIQLSSF